MGNKHYNTEVSAMPPLILGGGTIYHRSSCDQSKANDWHPLISCFVFIVLRIHQIYFVHKNLRTVHRHCRGQELWPLKLCDTYVCV